MDTQALTAFLSVAELQSFSEAAEKLHLTQPAVSKRIATLEKQLDCRLFDRIGRHVHLTEAGRSLLPVAQRVLQELRNARRQINDLRGTVAGRLTMGIANARLLADGEQIYNAEDLRVGLFLPEQM
mgnify:CR=1 FL=1